MSETPGETPTVSDKDVTAELKRSIVKRAREARDTRGSAKECAETLKLLAQAHAITTHPTVPR
jgi:hypothetical protein